MDADAISQKLEAGALLGCRLQETEASLIRGSTLGIEEVMPCLLELSATFLDDSLDPAKLDRGEPGTGC